MDEQGQITEDAIAQVQATVLLIETATGKTAFRWDIGPVGFVQVIYPDDDEHRAAIRQGWESPEVQMAGAQLIREEGEAAFVLPVCC